MIPDAKNNAHIIIANNILSKIPVIAVFFVQAKNILECLQKNALPPALNVKF